MDIKGIQHSHEKRIFDSNVKSVLQIVSGLKEVDRIWSGGVHVNKEYILERTLRDRLFAT